MSEQKRVGRQTRKEKGAGLGEAGEGREEGWEALLRCVCVRAAHCTCRLTTNTLGRSLPSEWRRGGKVEEEDEVFQ